MTTKPRAHRSVGCRTGRAPLSDSAEGWQRALAIEAVLGAVCRYRAPVTGAVQASLLFLDVDGPLIPFGATSQPYPTYVTGPAPLGADANPLLTRINPEHGPRLAALPCEVVWATTWMAGANECIAPRIGCRNWQWWSGRSRPTSMTRTRGTDCTGRRVHLSHGLRGVRSPGSTMSSPTPIGPGLLPTTGDRPCSIVSIPAMVWMTATTQLSTRGCDSRSDARPENVKRRCPADLAGRAGARRWFGGCTLACAAPKSRDTAFELWEPHPR